MSKVAELQSGAELPAWLDPMVEKIAAEIRSDLKSNTEALKALQGQLGELVEVQVMFLESIQQRSSGKSAS